MLKILPVVSALAISAVLISCSRSSQPSAATSAKSSEPSTPAKAAPAAATAPTPAPAAPAAPKNNENLPQVRLTTSMGDIVLELNREKAPISVANFLNYVDKGFYSNTIFHRVIPGFMIQGGGFNADLQEKPTDAPIKNEWQNGLKNEAYTLAMARTSVPDSATCQFYINTVNNPFLDKPNGGAAYAVFGKVISGTEVVDKIKAVKTSFKGGMGDVPEQAVVIIKAVREDRK